MQVFISFTIQQTRHNQITSLTSLSSLLTGLLLCCQTPPGQDHEPVHPERLHGSPAVQRGLVSEQGPLYKKALGQRRLPPPRPIPLPDQEVPDRRTGSEGVTVTGGCILV